MAKYTFLYIDDENDHSTKAIADGLKVNGLLEIVLAEPKEFKTQKLYFEQHLTEYDGIILDLRLDGIRLDIPYNAPAIAQELRMMAAEGRVKPCPIILCSTEEKMRATYEVDKTSHDLFDYKFHKQVAPPWEKFARKINSLASGYYGIQECELKMQKILGRDDLMSIDPRIFEKFEISEKSLAISEYASFVIKDFFHHPGPLIKETLLASRLGIDIKKSAGAWTELLERHFVEARYLGVFSDGWSRWWADRILEIFKSKTGKRLSTLNAESRVHELIKITGIESLVPAQPLEYSKSSNFWTVCEFYKAPLDPLEGFSIYSNIEPKSWQEKKYLSLKAVIERKGPRPSPSEGARIELIKKTLSEK